MKNFIVYQSSAGSGKTYTLVKEYLKIVLKNPSDFRQTLAVTFTTKATAEMSVRIIETLKKLAEGEEKNLCEDLAAETKIKDIPGQAKLVLENILHGYSDFNVSTIDSFFTRILRSFAREMKLQIGYDIELQQDDVLEKVADEMLDEIGTNEELTEYLTEYVFNNIDDDKGWKIDKHIKGLAKEIFKERYREKKNILEYMDIADTKKRVSELTIELKNIKYTFENFMFEKSKEAEEIMKRHKLTIDDFFQKKSGVMGYLLNHLRNKGDYEPGKRTLDAYNDRTKWYKKDSNNIPQINKALDEGLDELLHDVIDYFENGKKEYFSALAVLNTVYIIGIFEDLARKLRDYRNENKILFISDVNFMLESIISDDNCPFIYEKTGNKIKNFLIDEFQDTSNYQWKNFLPLIVNSLSENNFSMVVGDVKQAIYRWRNGNMKLMLEQIYKDLDNFRDSTENKNLDKNFRSFDAIVNFNNDFFTRAKEKYIFKKDEPGTDSEYAELIGRTYNAVEQTPDKNKKGGYVNFTFYKPVDEDEETPADKCRKRMIESINECIADGFDYKDITVITRKNGEAADIANFLAEHDLNVVSSESLLLFNSPKINFLINAFRYISDHRNTLARTEMLYNYLVYLKNEEPAPDNLFNKHKKESKELFFTELPGGFFRNDDKTKIKASLGSLTVYELTENLIQTFVLNSKPDAYLLKFQDVILEYSKKNNTDIISFLDWWEENKEKHSISLPDELDAIRVMTVHKAKGLQNKIIIIPFANWDLDIDSSKDLIVVGSDKPPFDKSSAYFVKPSNSLTNTYFENDFLNEYYLTKVDNLNLLYVAFTRAIERLYVTVPAKRAKDGIRKVIESVLLGITGKSEEFKDGEIYESGIKEKKKSKTKKSELESFTLPDYISTEWYRKIIIKPKYQKIKILKDETLTSKILWGVLLHNLLSYIHTPKDLDKAILMMQNEGVISDDMKAELSKKAGKVLKHKQAGAWFEEGWEVKAEADILTQSGTLLRPDRVIIKNNTACVIDYKTGKEKDEDKKQVINYAKILENMGFEKVEKYLMYINDEYEDMLKIVEIN
ncbi:MAG TPA: UvrD-helicase domain-containing protein [Ignavibacteria bacterium]